jgi:hypothetical protein
MFPGGTTGVHYPHYHVSFKVADPLFDQENESTTPKPTR